MERRLWREPGCVPPPSRENKNARQTGERGKRVNASPSPDEETRRRVVRDHYDIFVRASCVATQRIQIPRCLKGKVLSCDLEVSCLVLCQVVAYHDAVSTSLHCPFCLALAARNGRTVQTFHQSCTFQRSVSYTESRV